MANADRTAAAKGPPGRTGAGRRGGAGGSSGAAAAAAAAAAPSAPASPPQEASRALEALEALNRISVAVAAEHDRDRLVRLVVDAATEFVGAAFGAFFHNVAGERGETYTLYTLSGAPREAFERFPTPRKTAIFAPTFGGEGVVRSDDITRDPRYGRNPPHRGMPEGHLPVRSYLAVPVVGRSGEVVGGLFFGHPEPGAFDELAERLVVGVAAQAAVALENAALHRAAQREIEERQRAEAARAAATERERRRLEAVVEGIGEAVVAVFPKEGAWLRNRAWLPLHGFSSFDELPGREVGAFWHLFETRAADGAPVPRRDWPIARVLRGEGFSDVEVRLRRVDTGHERWISYNGTAVRDPDGAVALAILTMRDITGRKAGEERQRLLVAELAHRVKNTLAVVQGIAARSLSGGRTLEEAREALAKRLRALAGAHTLLTASEWRGASLRALAAAELAPFPGRAEAGGEDLTLGPKAAQSLALILHELATNAAKHGALSAPEGRVALEWAVEGSGDGARFRLTWRERGGPPAREPGRRGFGRTLIERAAAHDLRGRAELRFGPEGVTYELGAPLAEVVAA